MFSVIEAVIFDLDDTLYAERDFVLSGFRAVGKALGGSLGAALDEQLRRRFERGERGDLFTPVLKSLGGYRDESHIKTLVEIYREHTPEIVPYKGVREVLETVRKSRRVGLISDGICAVQLRKLDALGLQSCFDAVVITGQWGREYWKPHRRGFDHCVALLGVAHAQACYIGDNPLKDFVTIKKLGWKTICIRRQEGLYSGHTADAEHRAEYEVADLGEVPDLLTALDGRAVSV